MAGAILFVWCEIKSHVNVKICSDAHVWVKNKTSQNLLEKVNDCQETNGLTTNNEN